MNRSNISPSAFDVPITLESIFRSIVEPIQNPAERYARDKGSVSMSRQKSDK